MKKTALTILLIAVITMVFAGDPGNNETTTSNMLTSVKGMVKDDLSGEYLTGVKVLVEGTKQVGYTDFNGAFSISNLKPGKYDITVEMISYNKKKFKGVEIGPDKRNDLNVILDQSSDNYTHQSN